MPLLDLQHPVAQVVTLALAAVLAVPILIAAVADGYRTWVLARAEADAILLRARKGGSRA